MYAFVWESGSDSISNARSLGVGSGVAPDNLYTPPLWNAGAKHVWLARVAGRKWPEGKGD